MNKKWTLLISVCICAPILLLCIFILTHYAKIIRLEQYSHKGTPEHVILRSLGKPTSTYGDNDFHRMLPQYKLPEEAVKIYEYSTLAHYCFIMINNDGISLGNMWYKT